MENFGYIILGMILYIVFKFLIFVIIGLSTKKHTIEDINFLDSIAKDVDKVEDREEKLFLLFVLRECAVNYRSFKKTVTYADKVFNKPLSEEAAKIAERISTYKI